VLLVLVFLQTENASNGYIGLCACFIGGLLGFLVFNTHKASVFMGDTGSLALGGLIGSASIFTENSLFIPIIGIMFVLSSISVIVQVAYFKRTKKRVFLMAPLHHHFQEKGVSESKISFSYFLITLIVGLTTLAIY
jgi:phospho-N-acetylmuramoyl-pentapeptide-transferase